MKVTAVRDQWQGALNGLEQERQAVDARSREFVGTFYSMMLQQMRTSLPGNPLVDGGRGEKIFQQQLDNHYGVEMAGQDTNLRLRDGTVRHLTNPLADQFAKSLTRSLDKQIGDMRNRLKDLEATLENLDKPLPAVSEEIKALDQSRQATRKKMEDLQVTASGISSHLIKTTGH